MLTLLVLDKNTSLNHLIPLANSISFASGETVTLRVMLWQSQKQIRYIPAVGATFSIVFKTSDDSINITKNATQPFSADDRSILEFSLSAAETAQIISQKLIATITEGAVVTLAVLDNGLQKTSLGSGC